MATLLDALSDGSYDLQNKRDLSGDFSKKLLRYRDSVVSDYLKYKIDLSKAISSIAKRDSLNDDQIQRIVEEVNNQVYLTLYEKTKNSNERDVDFNIASISKVKDAIKGESVNKEDLTKKEDVEEKKSEKTAFETEKGSFEKVASTNAPADIFSGNLQYKFGNMSIPMGKSREEFLTQKIASKLKEYESDMDKIARDINHTAMEIGDTMVNLEMLGCNVSSIMSSMVKQSSLNERQVELIKEASVKRITTLTENGVLPSDFQMEFNVSTEKTASEKFSLGNHSLIKEAQVTIPRVCLFTNKQVGCFDDILKMASEMKEKTRAIGEKNSEYMKIKEKCASAGISEEKLSEGFFH